MNITITKIHKAMPWTDGSGNVAHYCQATDANGQPRFIVISMKNQKYFPQPGGTIDVNFKGTYDQQQEFDNGVGVLDASTGQPKVINYERVSRVQQGQGGGQRGSGGGGGGGGAPGGNAAPAQHQQHQHRVVELPTAKFLETSAKLTIMSFVALVTATRTSPEFTALGVPLDTTALWGIAGNHAYGASMGLGLRCVSAADAAAKNEAALAEAARLKKQAEDAAAAAEAARQAALAAAAPGGYQPGTSAPPDDDIPF